MKTIAWDFFGSKFIIWYDSLHLLVQNQAILTNGKLEVLSWDPVPNGERLGGNGFSHPRLTSKEMKFLPAGFDLELNISQSRRLHN